MLHRRIPGLAAALLLTLIAVPAQAVGPANVNVRVEGTAQTLLPRTAVTTTTAPVNKDGAHACTGTSAAGALELATAGAWNGPWSSFGDYFVASIKGESPSGDDYFAFWVNNRESSTGVCGAELQAGDQVLFFVASCTFDGTQCSNPPVLPLGLSVPGRATPGAPFGVRVVEYATDGTPTPVSGATVSGGDATATTGGDGVASLTLAQRGDVTLRATKANRAPSASEGVCVTDGADGACGTTAAVAPDAAGAGTVCQSAGDDGLCGTADRRAARARILSIREQQRFRRGRAPRVLRGSTAADPSGVRDVRLRLTRTDAGRCETFDARRERFVALSRCGAARGRWFSVGDRSDWTYLLPRALTRGRYVLDVETLDGAGNRDTLLQRTRNRVVFFVA